MVLKDHAQFWDIPPISNAGWDPEHQIICVRYPSGYRFLLAAPGQTVDRMRHESGPESIVDIHHADAACARVEHRQQRGKTLEVGAVAYRRRHGDHRLICEPANDGSERALHARDDHDDVGGVDLIHSRQQTMNARHADIANKIDVVA